MKTLAAPDDIAVPLVSSAGEDTILSATSIDDDSSFQMASNRMDSLRSSQFSRRTSLAALIEDCPICLDAMGSVDVEHILQCERHCGFNMCKNCIDSLITSSKDDFQMASDGNMHVKVYLHCPNCRSDLSHSIRHTLLLRKVDELELLTCPESEWTNSQVRLKRALHTTEVLKAIKHARIVEAEYYGRDLNDSFNDSDDSETDSQIEQYVEQWGVEVDLTNGTHNSFVTPRPPAVVFPEEAIRIDPTLFAGLDSFLSEDEQKEVTKLMTGGKPSLLVEAANILYDTLQKLYNPEPSATGKNLLNRKNSRRKSLARKSSVFQLIAEAEVAEGKRDKEARKTAEEMQALQNPRFAQQRQLERDLRIRANFQKRFPIPVRMPKAVKLDLSLPFDMELVDYNWGGTVMDAYSKISIGFGSKVTQRRPNNINVGTIIGSERSVVKSAAVGCAIGLCMSRDDDYGDAANDIYIAIPGQARVVVSNTGHIGKLGAVRGDVLTHIDGESITGKKVAEVLDIINAKKCQGSTLLTLNAEFSVADALRRRAMAISEIEIM
ncbi:unnamed protein product [Pseudo-nitzschia multistriata]|uniref:RING-type domain-containing protein n=1 Tax=Pseudo-nitzschia multistriata TaxID=183589 RepID=A0A448ZSL8_9STRA|nr:unnamed protein product [Pseudo-nitzschia multistriata]